MKWRRIIKDPATFPAAGGYKEWKSLLATEGEKRCVYCCVLEAHFGGPRNYHVEHFRPKSRFGHLENSYENLFYACAICNSFKGNDWPREPGGAEYGSAFYPDPSLVDYSDLLLNDPETGVVTSVSVTGRYLIERLFINRPQMIANRKILVLAEQLRSLIEDLESLNVAGKIPQTLGVRAFSFMAAAAKAFEALYRATPYRTEDVTRR